MTDHDHRHSIGIGLSRGSGDCERGRDRSRDTFSALALSLPPAGGGAGGNPGGGQGESCGPGGPGGVVRRIKRNIRTIKEGKLWRRWRVGLISFVLRCNSWELTSFQNTTIVHARGPKAVLKKLNWAAGQTLTPIGLERIFQRCTQELDSPLAAKITIATEGALKQHSALEVHIRQKMTSKDGHMR